VGRDLRAISPKETKAQLCYENVATATMHCVFPLLLLPHVSISFPHQVTRPLSVVLHLDTV
jgi:hypothetical protein